jgi:hypothetical protein
MIANRLFFSIHRYNFGFVSIQEQQNTECEAKGQSSEQVIHPPLPQTNAGVAESMDRNKIRELVTTEISLERQLESVQSQLLALKQLPSEIERHLAIVSEQLHKIMELSGVEKTGGQAAKGERKLWVADGRGLLEKAGVGRNP